MYARVTTVQIPDATTSADILRVHERLLTELEGANGFIKYTALINRQRGTAIGISYWETEADMQESAAGGKLVRARVIGELNAAELSVEECEVAVHRDTRAKDVFARKARRRRG